MALENIFTTVCNMTFTASVVIGCVLLARIALKNAPRVFSYALWLVVLFRLLCPVSLPSPVSVLNVVEVPQVAVSAPAQPVAEMPGIPAQTELATGIQTPEKAPSVSPAVQIRVDWRFAAALGWAVGTAVLGTYGILSYVNLKRKLRESIPAEPGVREIDESTTPFVLGFFRPVIYLPSGLDGREREYVLLHERLHVRHLDLQIRVVFFAAVCLHWFNPLVWVAFFLCGRDMEMRCDEAVLKALGGEIRSDYAQSLLNFATGRFALAAPLAFGEGDTGKRVRNVLNWKKKGRWMLILAAIVCAGVFLMTGCDPQSEPESPFGHSYRAQAISMVAGDAPVETYEFTLTSDQMVLVNHSGLEGQMALLEVPRGTPDPDTLPEGVLKGKSQKVWKTASGEKWLFQREDGLWLWKEGEYLVKLQRVDLLNVVIQTARGENHLMPVWCPQGEPEERRSDLRVTLAEDTATLRFEPAVDVEKIMVSEEYFQADSSGGVVVTDTVLERKDGFTMEVRRRGDTGDDYAIYTVHVAGEVWLFQLNFPAEPPEPTHIHVNGEDTDRLTYNDGAYISLSLPRSWEYSFDHPEGEDAYSYGISFWPAGYEGAALRLHFYPQGFGVCGTGLETTEMELAGRKVSVGTYDGHGVWDYIAFGDDFAVLGQGHEVWWDEYGDTAMEILNSAELGPEVE